MIVQTWGDVLNQSLQELWGGVLMFVPKFVIALIIFIIGWVIAVALGKIVEQIVKALKVDLALKSLGVEEPLDRAGMKLDAGAFLGGLVRWFVILVFVLAASYRIFERRCVGIYSSSNCCRFDFGCRRVIS